MAKKDACFRMSCAQLVDLGFDFLPRFEKALTTHKLLKAQAHDSKKTILPCLKWVDAQEIGLMYQTKNFKTFLIVDEIPVQHFWDRVRRGDLPEEYQLWDLISQGKIRACREKGREVPLNKRFKCGEAPTLASKRNFTMKQVFSVGAEHLQDDIIARFLRTFSPLNSLCVPSDESFNYNLHKLSDENSVNWGRVALEKWKTFGDEFAQACQDFQLSQEELGFLGTQYELLEAEVILTAAEKDAPQNSKITEMFSQYHYNQEGMGISH